MRLVLHVVIFNCQIYLHEHEQRTVFCVPGSSAGVGSVAGHNVLDSDIPSGASELSGAASAPHLTSSSSSAFSTHVYFNYVD